MAIALHWVDTLYWVDALGRHVAVGVDTKVYPYSNFEIDLILRAL
jgi:hypothetical protein